MMSTPASAAASKLAIVLPGTIPSAPLWPIRSSRSTPPRRESMRPCTARTVSRALGYLDEYTRRRVAAVLLVVGA